ncbi:hypothetical protein L1856_07450 [Streptomyces sp. Tue 6430]|nr:hypothetical protein [Streptomyces sp. Tue 6430]
MQEWNYSPTAVTVPRLILDPYRCGVDANAALEGADAGGGWGDEDWHVPPRARAGAETEEEARRAPGPSRRPPLSPPTAAVWNCTRHSSGQESRPNPETCTPWRR